MAILSLPFLQRLRLQCVPARMRRPVRMPAPSQVVLSRVRTLSLCAVAYWREVSQDLGKAAASLARFLEMQRRLYWRRPPWRGVNLGGWLLLEPGPSHELFQQFGARNSHCEWQLLHQMRNKLGPQRAAEVLEAHRSTFVTEEDFQQIKSYGFNAVRIPFGYWIVTGPSNGDLYVGPALDILDRALAWCKHLGLQVLLDLHGAPGGESGETPCGREMKDWRWERWRFEESLEAKGSALKIIAERYKGHPAVSGIAVCNEPSEKVPADVLCQFYDQAIQAIRAAGMPPDEVSIVLPVYRTERLDEIWRLWNKVFDGFARHANVAFDLHLYHCFGAWWQRQGLKSHLRMTKRDRKILRRVPAVVGEWSLALPDRAMASSENDEEAYRSFASAQLDAYGHASHGWFFWNWRDSPEHHGWDAKMCLQRHWLSPVEWKDIPRSQRSLVGK
ncbi:3-beta-glucanase 1) (Exo-1 [Durusdinium trenchii]|uniref:glucan 1,3-beta-glucosidase n=1 Tax=Durusdinium trenchii TaxID=1381693 RepID=A0ABP0NQQ3_9DINO